MFSTLLVVSVGKIVQSYTRLQAQLMQLSDSVVLKLLESTYFLKDYYRLNDLMWQDGFLIDFLQKKVVDKWVRRFLVYSAYLFNERLVFDWVVRFYIELIIWPSHRFAIFEFNSVASTILATLVALISLFLGIFFWYMCMLVLA